MSDTTAVSLMAWASPQESPVDAELQAVDAVLHAVDYRPAGRPQQIRVDRRHGRLVLRSVAGDGGYLLTTTFSGDPHDESNVLANVAQHVASTAASDALGSLRHNGALIHDTATEGDPHVIVPPRPVDYSADAARANMLARRRAREATGGHLAGSDDPELDAFDAILSNVKFRWPGSTVSGLWGERWSDVVQPKGPGGLRYGRCGVGDLWIASDAGRLNSDTGRPFGKDAWARSLYFHPCTPFDGDPSDREQVLAAAARHIAWFAAHECLEWATVDGQPLYNPHRMGEPVVTLPGLPGRPSRIRRLMAAWE